MLAFDVIEEILLRSAVKDLIPWKVVCKSWYSLISTSRFANLHLKKTRNNTNKDIRHIRIIMPIYKWDIIMLDERVYQSEFWKVVGSSNGLVCISRFNEVWVNNPWTRETRKLPMSPFSKTTMDPSYGFGYDSSTGDYKVVMVIWKDIKAVLVQVFSLKSNTWKHIGEFKYRFLHREPTGILHNGALHWFVLDYSNGKGKKAILSFDLLREDFSVIPQPNDWQYKCRASFPSLGIVEDQLCIFYCNINNDNDLPRGIWVMRSYNTEQSWERLPNDYEMKYDVLNFNC